MHRLQRFVVFHSFDKKDVMRVEMLPGRSVLRAPVWREPNCLVAEALAGLNMGRSELP